jgi:hypothetical protein
MTDTEQPRFLDATTFQLGVEALTREKRIDHLDAVIMFCKENDLEPDEIKKLLTSNLKDKIKMAAIDGGYMKREATLPI